MPSSAVQPPPEECPSQRSVYHHVTVKPPSTRQGPGSFLFCRRRGLMVPQGGRPSPARIPGDNRRRQQCPPGPPPMPYNCDACGEDFIIGVRSRGAVAGLRPFAVLFAVSTLYVIDSHSMPAPFYFNHCRTAAGFATP